MIKTKHANFFEIKAETNYELGLQLGELFKSYLNSKLEISRLDPNWQKKIINSQKFILPTFVEFPNLILELQGYAKGADAMFEELFLLMMENESSLIDKCSTYITNNGKLIAHNEDWDSNSKDAICILKKTVKDLTIFELFYYNTLGGNAASYNSNGYVQSINSLLQNDNRIGIPQNIIGRFMSETNDPAKDFNKFQKIIRASGYNHNLISKSGEIFNIESSATSSVMEKVESPFIHTNHYLGTLKTFESNDNSSYTFERYNFLKSKLQNEMSIEELQRLMSDTSLGNKSSVFNERTIARTIFDLNEMVVYIWLLRENDLNWVKYNL